MSRKRPKDYDRWSMAELARLLAAYKRARPQLTKHRFYLEVALSVRRTPGAVMWALQHHWRLGPKLNYKEGIE